MCNGEDEREERGGGIRKAFARLDPKGEEEEVAVEEEGEEEEKREGTSLNFSKVTTRIRIGRTPEFEFPPFLPFPSPSEGEGKQSGGRGDGGDKRALMMFFEATRGQKLDPPPPPSPPFLSRFWMDC